MIVVQVVSHFAISLHASLTLQMVQALYRCFTVPAGPYLSALCFNIAADCLLDDRLS